MPKRRIKKAKIRFISLVPRGANTFPVLYKGEGSSAQFSTLIKDDRFEEHGEITAIVYAPELRDSQGDIASAQVIKAMAYDFSRDGGDLDVMHDGVALTKEQAYVAETYIIKHNDPDFAGISDYDGNPVTVTGGWAVVIKVDDEGLREAYRSGDWNGVSMAGPAEVIAEKSAETHEELLSALAKRLTNNPPKKDVPMTPEELEKIADLVTDKLLEKGATSTDPAEPAAAAPAAPKAPVFSGDPTNDDDLKKHHAALVKFQLLQTVDFSDPEKVKELMKSSAPAAPAAAPTDSPEVALLKQQLREAESRSNQPSGSGSPVAPANPLQAQLAKGKRIADAINARTSANPYFASRN